MDHVRARGEFAGLARETPCDGNRVLLSLLRKCHGTVICN